MQPPLSDMITSASAPSKYCWVSNDTFSKSSDTNIECYILFNVRHNIAVPM